MELQLEQFLSFGLSRRPPMPLTLLNAAATLTSAS